MTLEKLETVKFLLLCQIFSIKKSNGDVKEITRLEDEIVLLEDEYWYEAGEDILFTRKETEKAQQ